MRLYSTITVHYDSSDCLPRPEILIRKEESGSATVFYVYKYVQMDLAALIRIAQDMIAEFPQGEFSDIHFRESNQPNYDGALVASLTIKKIDQKVLENYSQIVHIDF